MTLVLSESWMEMEMEMERAVGFARAGEKKTEETAVPYVTSSIYGYGAAHDNLVCT
jgi:hypothetical protein